MTNKKNTNNPKTRNRYFGSSLSLMYNGNLYPASETSILNEDGTTTTRNIGVDANNNYFYVENGQPRMVESLYNLPEVTVTGKRNSNAQNYLTMSNDATQVNNLPHKIYNLNLQQRALEGAEDHAQWEKEHPNAAAWSNALAAAPFAVAAAPVVLGAGEALAGTTLGQSAINGISAAIANPVVNGFNTALGLGFTAKSAYDVSQGKFTPETALDLIPLGGVASPIIKEGKHLATNINDYNNINKFIKRYGYTEYKPKLGLIFDDNKLDRLTNQLVRQHNRFVRGVSVSEARKYYGFSEDWTDEQIAEYVLTHPHIPNALNSGGNPERNPVLYISNSIDLAKQYTDGNGYIGILQRPITYNADRSKMLEMNDFRFNKLPDIANNKFNPSVTTDEPFILRNLSQKHKFSKDSRVKGGLAYKHKNRVVRTYSPVSPTFLDAQANAGSYLYRNQLPDDVNFRHYLFFGDPDDELLGLEKLIKYTKPEGAPSVDYKPYSIGFSKKKALGGKL